MLVSNRHNNTKCFTVLIFSVLVIFLLFYLAIMWQDNKGEH